MTFKLQCQDLSIDKLNFAEQSFEGITKLVLWPLDKNLKTIELNCNGPEIKEIFIQKVGFENETFYTSYQRFDEDFISIFIPKELENSIRKLDCLAITIHFKSVGNRCGLQFVISATGTTGSYMYCAPFNNKLGTVFPCRELSHACEWWIEIISPQDGMIVAASGDLVSKDDDAHIFHISRKTTARNISFIVGEMDFLVDNENPKFGYYCPYQLTEYLKASIVPMTKALEFLKTKFQMDFPFSSYKAVFVEYLLEDHYTASSLSLFDVHLLHNNRIVEQMFYTPQSLTVGLCEQYIGSFIEPKTSNDFWICWGLAEHLGWEFVRSSYLEDREEDALYEIKSKMDSLVDYERKNEGIVLNFSSHTEELDVINPSLMSPRYKRFYRIKSGLVMRSWILTVSLTGVCDIIRTHLKREIPVDSSIIYKKCLGRWRSLIENLVNRKGHTNIAAKAHYHKKMKTIELVVAQVHDNVSYFHSGVLSMEIQEPDGLFVKVVRLKPEISSHIEIATCSKLTHLKVGQKLVTRKRDHIDGSNLGWVHLDPEMRFVGKMRNLMLVDEAKLMAQNESNVWAKFCGLVALARINSTEHLQWLMAQINKRKIPTRIRLQAINQMRNALFDSTTDFPRDSLKTALVHLFCEVDEANPVLRMNCWRNLGDYRIHLALVEAVSITYVPDSPDKWVDFFRLYVDMLDACGHFSKVSASHFRASLITGLGNVFVIVTRSFIQESYLQTFVDILNKQLIEDMAVPSHNYCVTSAVLHSLAKLNQNGLLSEIPPSVFFSYDYDDNEHVRLAGISALLSYLDHVDQAENPFDEIIRYLSKSEVPVTIRCKGVILISEKLQTLKHSCSVYVIEKLYNLISGHLDCLSKMATDDNPHPLLGSVKELLHIIHKLKCPVVDADSKILLDTLDRPIMDKDIIPVSNVQHFITEGDGNLSDDSD